jgi:hypothetical protein
MIQKVMDPLMSESGAEERKWDEEFEDIIDDPKQHPIVFYEGGDADLGPAIAEGSTLKEAIEAYIRERDNYE